MAEFGLSLALLKYCFSLSPCLKGPGSAGLGMPFVCGGPWAQHPPDLGLGVGRLRSGAHGLALALGLHGASRNRLKLEGLQLEPPVFLWGGAVSQEPRES